MSQPRTRSGKSGFSSGFLVERFHRSDWDEYEFASYWKDQAIVTDVIGSPVNGQLFDLKRWRVFSGAISGVGTLPWNGRTVEASNFLPTRYSFGNGAAITQLLTPAEVRISDNNLQYLYTGFVNQTNPGRSDANVLVSLVELREVPALIRQAKELINVRKLLRRPIKALGDNYLAYQFGIGPMLGDLETALSLPQLIEKRVKELSKIRDTGILRKTRRLFSDGNLVKRTVDATSWPFFMTYDEVESYQNSVWGHVNWTCDSLRGATDVELAAIARSALLDGNISINDLWELVPWSWLADYFSSAGDYLSYIGNRIPGSVDRGSVMQRTDHYLVAKYRGVIPGLKVPQVVLGCNSKYRLPGEPGAYVTTLDVLSGHQLSIITALVASSRAGYTRSD